MTVLCKNIVELEDRHLAARHDDDRVGPIWNEELPSGRIGLSPVRDAGDQHVRFQAQILELLADVARILMDDELQRLGAAVGDAVQQCDRRAGLVLHGAHVLHDVARSTAPSG